MLKKLPKREDIVERVQTQLSKALRGGNPSIEAIADALNMTTRTLQ